MPPPTFHLLIRFAICAIVRILTLMRATFTCLSQWAGELGAYPFLMEHSVFRKWGLERTPLNNAKYSIKELWDHAFLMDQQEKKEVQPLFAEHHTSCDCILACFGIFVHGMSLVACEVILHQRWESDSNVFLLCYFSLVLVDVGFTWQFCENIVTWERFWNQKAFDWLEGWM